MAIQPWSCPCVVCALSEILMFNIGWGPIGLVLMEMVKLSQEGNYAVSYGRSPTSGGTTELDAMWKL